MHTHALSMCSQMLDWLVGLCRNFGTAVTNSEFSYYRKGVNYLHNLGSLDAVVSPVLSLTQHVFVYLT